MIIYESIFKKYGLSRTQQEIIKIVGLNKVVLEIGSSTGYMTKIFLGNNCIVDVVEAQKEALAKLPNGIRKALNYSIENIKIKKLLAKDYDFIIMADVLEHLINPSQALNMLSKTTKPQTKLIISMPNIASWVMRKELFFKGNFEYQDSGILDRTHLHFYTTKTLPKLLSENGWQMKEMIGTITRLPLDGLVERIPIISLLYKKFIREALTEQFKNLSYYHILVTASKNEKN